MNILVVKFNLIKIHRKIKVKHKRKFIIQYKIKKSKEVILK